MPAPRLAFCVVLSTVAAFAGDAASPIVNPAWLKRQLAAPTVDLVVVEASWTPPGKPNPYARGHIPGAIHLNTDDLENGYPRWHLRPDAELQGVIGKLGILPDSMVVVYGAQSIAAARAWWVLHYAGVRDVRYLDGGFEAWTRAGYPGETAIRAPSPTRFDASVRAEARATTDYVAEHAAANEVALADVRGDAEFRGATSGYSYLQAKGRIPGAIAAGNAGDSARLYQNPNGTLRSVAEIRRRWQGAGILDSSGQPRKEIVFYCGSGWRSSLAFLYARAMGLTKIRNYSDGWSGWSTDYREDPGAGGITPGWRQTQSKNAVAVGR